MLSAEQREVILIAWGDASTGVPSVPSTKSRHLSKKADETFTYLFSVPVVPYSISPHPHKRYGAATWHLLDLETSKMVRKR